MGEIIDGQPLFPGESEIDQLYLIQKVLGPLTWNQQEVFLKNPRFIGLKFPEITKLEVLEKRFLKAERAALDFMYRLLRMEPGERMTAGEALVHPFLNETFERPISSAVIQRTDSAKNRGKYQGCINMNKNRKAFLLSNATSTDNRKTAKNSGEKSLSPAPPLIIKETQFVVPPDTVKTNKSITNKDNISIKLRASPFAIEQTADFRIERQRSKEALRHVEFHNNNESKPPRKKKSGIEDNQAFVMNKEEEVKISPRAKPYLIKKKNGKLLYPQEVQYDNIQIKNLRSGIFNRGLPKASLIEPFIEPEEYCNQQSARQLPNIYVPSHVENKKNEFRRQKDDDPDLSGGPQHLIAFQPEEYVHSKQFKQFNYEYKQR